MGGRAYATPLGVHSTQGGEHRTMGWQHERAWPAGQGHLPASRGCMEAPTCWNLPPSPDSPPFPPSPGATTHHLGLVFQCVQDLPPLRVLHDCPRGAHRGALQGQGSTPALVRAPACRAQKSRLDHPRCSLQHYNVPSALDDRLTWPHSMHFDESSASSISTPGCTCRERLIMPNTFICCRAGLKPGAGIRCQTHRRVVSLGVLWAKPCFLTSTARPASHALNSDCAGSDRSAASLV